MQGSDPDGSDGSDGSGGTEEVERKMEEEAESER
jgi:hypothetical protein